MRCIECLKDTNYPVSIISRLMAGPLITKYNESYQDDVHFVELPDTPEELHGSRQHPGIVAHRNVADVLADYLISNCGLEV